MRGDNTTKPVVVIASALTIAGLVILFQWYSVPAVSYVGILVPVAIIALFVGIRPASIDSLTPTEEVSNEAGTFAFWLLLGIIVVDEFFGVFSVENVKTIYIYAGILSLLVAFVATGIRHRYAD